MHIVVVITLDAYLVKVKILGGILLRRALCGLGISNEPSEEILGVMKNLCVTYIS